MSNLGLKEEKTQNFMEFWFVKLRLEEEYNYNILLRMTSKNFEEIFQLIKGGIPEENTNLREIVLPTL